ncbi:MAG: hypothetical protein E6J14_10725 [Chloroflexi bacterium]|nr:MAG: hypothetical protein E6J14_10725 [Chloroflexota bacterium]
MVYRRVGTLLVGAAGIAGLIGWGPAINAVAAPGGGGCQLQGTANISPGLSNTSQNFTYNFGGNLSSCQSNMAGSPTSGTVSAGQVYTPAGSTLHYQEPASTGTGSCATSTTSGTGIIVWADGTITVVSYTTNGAAAAVALQGTVAASITLPPTASDPPGTAPLTVTTTRFAGDSALGTLAFQPPDPTACSGAGVTTAGINGFVGVGSSS